MGAHFRFLVAGFVLGTALACSPSPERSWELADDLVLSESLKLNGGSVTPEEATCADETWMSVPLSVGDTVSVETAWLRGSQLELMACADNPATWPPAANVGIRWSLTGADIGLSGFLKMGDGPGWRHQAVTLPDGGGRGVLTLEVEAQPGRTLWLRDAVVRRNQSGEHRRPAGHQILLISIDTLRADAIGRVEDDLHSGFRDFLDEAEGWTVHYSGASWTLPSHATMLTGVPAWVHGAVGRGFPIHESVPTLAERMRVAGLRTAAIAYGSEWMKPEWGFDRGFESYEWARWRVDRQTRRAAKWIYEHREEGFFYFFHTFEPHSDFERLPYEAPGVSRETVEHRFSVTDYGCREGLCASRMLAAINRGRINATESDRLVLPGLYGEGVRFTTAALGELFHILRSGGVWDDLTVIVTSDHGEEFFEHGGVLHGSLYEEVLRVPLWIKWPRGRRAGVRNGHPTTSIDLVPTVLEVVGERDERLRGHPLQRPSVKRVICAGDFDKAVIAGQRKALFLDDGDVRRMFDLAVDPAEQVDYASSVPEVVEHIHHQLMARVIEDRERWGVEGWSPVDRSRVELTAEEQDRLRALGYLQ